MNLMNDPFAGPELYPELRKLLVEVELAGAEVEERAALWREAYGLEDDPINRHNMRVLAWENELAKLTGEDWQDDVTVPRHGTPERPVVGFGESQFYRGCRLNVRLDQFKPEGLWTCSATIDCYDDTWVVVGTFQGWPTLHEAYRFGMEAAKSAVDSRLDGARPH